MKRAQAVTQRVGTGEIGERARIHIGWAKILPSLHGEDDDNGDNDDNGENDGDNNGERAWIGKQVWLQATRGRGVHQNHQTHNRVRWRCLINTYNR